MQQSHGEKTKITNIKQKINDNSIPNNPITFLLCSKVSYILSREPQVEGGRFFLVFVFLIQKERIHWFMQHWMELCDLGQVGGLGGSLETERSR